MCKSLALLVLAVSTTSFVQAEVPERYRDTWSIDSDASLAAVDTAEPPRTENQKMRLVRGITTELEGLVLEITADARHHKMPQQSMTHRHAGHDLRHCLRPGGRQSLRFPCRRLSAEAL